MDRPLNPTTLAREFNLPWRPGWGAERLTWEQFYEILEQKYWATRTQRKEAS